MPGSLTESLTNELEDTMKRRNSAASIGAKEVGPEPAARFKDQLEGSSLEGREEIRLSKPKSGRLRGAASLTFLGLVLAPIATGAGPKPGGPTSRSAAPARCRTDFSAGSYDQAFAVAIEGDGKAVVRARSDNRRGRLRRHALLRGGALDTTFDGERQGQASFAPTSIERSYALALQTDGKYVLAGTVGIPGSGTASDFALARYNVDGTLDGSFDGDGKVVTDFASLTDQAFAVAIQTDGKIVAASTTRSPSTNRFDYALARYNPNGTLDTSFSEDGMVRFGLGGTDEFAEAVVVQPDGKILLGGVDLTTAPALCCASCRMERGTRRSEPAESSTAKAATSPTSRYRPTARSSSSVILASALRA